MVIRIEDAGLTRGREFSLFAYSTVQPQCKMWGYSPMSGVIEIDHETVTNGKFYIFKAIAPQIDGYLLAKVGKQKVIKRIGNPVFRAFVYGYKKGYSVPYTYYDIEANVLESGVLDSVVDVFYSKPLSDDVAMVDVMGKKILISKNIAKMNYEVRMAGGRLNSTLGSARIESFDLPSVTLPNVEIEAGTLDSELPDVEIKEL
jgi:hypothetical protein